LINNVDNGLIAPIMTQFYLDYNATAPLRSAARREMEAALSLGPLNASSIHGFGREGRKLVETARNQVAGLVGATPSQVIFNSGATEGNNTVIRYFETLYPQESILVSTIEHPSVLEASKNLKLIPVDEHGLVKLQELEKLLQSSPKTSLVSVMAVNNESGVIQDIAAIAALAHRHSALFHTDATQAAGRIPLDMAGMGIDFLTLSSHKIGGPQGVGALAMGSCGVTPVLLHGGGQEKSARAGTENVAGIAGFGAAAQESLEYLNHYQALGTWRDRLETAIASISPNIVFHSKGVSRVANTSFFSLPSQNSQSLLIAFDLEGIAISNGSACSSGSVKPSYVLKAMGKSDRESSSALRVSLGWATKEADIDAFLKAWEKIYKRVSA
jgi:cysteine desulfurase